MVAHLDLRLEKYIDTDPDAGKKHFEAQVSKVAEYKPTIRIIKSPVNTEEKYYKRSITDCRPTGVKLLAENHAFVKPRPERAHKEEVLSGSVDPFKGGLKPIPEKHQRTEKEHEVKEEMGAKKRVEGLEAQRNELPVRNLGDKPYKYAEDSNEFFKEGGLVPGSTQPVKMEKRSTGNTKIVDYYATLDISRPVMKKGMKWKDKLKFEQLEEDKKAVNELIQWYLSLKECDIGKRQC